MSLKLTGLAKRFVLSGLARTVLLELTDLAAPAIKSESDPRRYCSWPSVSLLMDLTGASENAIRGALKELAEAGLITIIAEGSPRKSKRGLRANCYRLNFATPTGLAAIIAARPDLIKAPYNSDLGRSKDTTGLLPAPTPPEPLDPRDGEQYAVPAFVWADADKVQAWRATWTIAPEPAYLHARDVPGFDLPEPVADVEFVAPTPQAALDNPPVSAGYAQDNPPVSEHNPALTEVNPAVIEVNPPGTEGEPSLSPEGDVKGTPLLSAGSADAPGDDADMCEDKCKNGDDDEAPHDAAQKSEPLADALATVHTLAPRNEAQDSVAELPLVAYLALTSKVTAYEPPTGARKLRMQHDVDSVYRDQHGTRWMRVTANPDRWKRIDEPVWDDVVM